jgi:hypothetical protein
MTKQSIIRDERGATVVELAFALPTFIVLVWMMVQLGLVFRANSGIQHALGQGARFATLYPTPTDAAIDARMNEAVDGIGPGTFATVVQDVAAQGYKDLTVTYSQPTDFLLFPGPTIHVRKAKRVWVAGGLRGTKTCADGTVIPSTATCPGTTPSPTPTTQTCPDGTVIPSTATCPGTTPPPTPTTQTCPDGSVIASTAICPGTTTPPPPPPPPTPTPTPTPSPSPGNSGNGGNTVCKNVNPRKCQ